MSLIDRLIEPTKNYISFRDFLFHLSSSNNEPLYEVVTHLLHHDLNSIEFYCINADYKITPRGCDDKNYIHRWLKEIQNILFKKAEAWVFSDNTHFSQPRIKLVENEVDGLGDTEKGQLTKAIWDYNQFFFKKSDLLIFEPLRSLLHFDVKTINDNNLSSDSNIRINNNSLASYLIEYTLPQVVALILKIDLSDITTQNNNSYINNQFEYSEDYYHKFQNLLQSYAASALNHKPDGINLVINSNETAAGISKSEVNIENTNISREKLSEHLSNLGYELDDLIAEQEQSGSISEDCEEVSYELDEQISDYKNRIIELEQEIAEANTTNHNLTMSSVAYSEHKTYEQKINNLNEQLKEQAGKPVDKHLYNWQAMDKNQYPPELHLAMVIWKEYYQADVIKHITQFDSGRFNRICTKLNISKGNLKDRIRTLLTPLESKLKSPSLIESFKVIDTIHTDKLEQD